MRARLDDAELGGRVRADAAVPSVPASSSGVFAQARRDGTTARHRRRPDRRGDSRRDGQGHRPGAGDPIGRRSRRCRRRIKASRRSPASSPAATSSRRRFPDSKPASPATFASATGDNKQSIVLAIQKLTDEITVGRDKQEAAADARVTFGSALTREQIDALSDDPNEMRAAAAGHGRSRRRHPGRQLRRRRSAAQVADQVDPRHARRASRRRTTTPARSSSTSSPSRASARCAAAGASAFATAR